MSFSCKVDLFCGFIKKIFFFCLLLALCAGCQPNMEDVNETSDSYELLKIVREAKDEQVRIAAINKMSDQKAIHYLTLKIGEPIPENLQLLALGKIDDQELLKEIATSSIASDVVKIAVMQRLGDNDALMKIAQEGRTSEVREAAVKHIDDEELLLQLARNRAKMKTAAAAAGRIRNPATLIELAKSKETPVLVRKAAVQHIDNQQVLMDLCLNMKRKDIYGSEVAAAALEKIDNETALHNILRKTTSFSVGKAVLEKFSSQEMFFNIVTSGYSTRDFDTLQALAVEKITDKKKIVSLLKDRKFSTKVTRALINSVDDQETFIDLVKTGETSEVREFAADKISDEKTLLTLLQSGLSKRLADHLFSRLKEQSSFAELIRSEISNKIRFQAIKKLTDTTLLHDFAVNHKNSSIRQHIVGKVTDSDLLVKIVAQDPSAYVRRAAAGKILDQQLLAKLAKEDPSSAVRKVATESILDQKVLLAIAQQDTSSYVKAVAADRLSDLAAGKEIKKKLPKWFAEANGHGLAWQIKKATVKKQQYLADIALNDTLEYARRAAAARLTDQKLLTEITQNDEEYVVRGDAIKNLKNQDVLLTLARTDENSHYVRQAAVANLTDQQLLRDFADNDFSEEVRSAALGGITDLQFVIEAAEHEENKKVQRSGYARVAELTKIPVDCDEKANSDCNTCSHLGKLSVLLAEQAVREQHGKLSMAVKAKSYNQKYTLGSMYAQTLTLNIKNTKGKAIFKEKDTDYNFPYSTPSLATMCADIDWQKLSCSVVNSLPKNAQGGLNEKYCESEN